MVSRSNSLLSGFHMEFPTAFLFIAEVEFGWAKQRRSHAMLVGLGRAWRTMACEWIFLVLAVLYCNVRVFSARLQSSPCFRPYKSSCIVNPLTNCEAHGVVFDSRVLVLLFTGSNRLYDDDDLELLRSFWWGSVSSKNDVPPPSTRLRGKRSRLVHLCILPYRRQLLIPNLTCHAKVFALNTSSMRSV